MERCKIQPWATKEDQFVARPGSFDGVPMPFHGMSTSLLSQWATRLYQAATMLASISTGSVDDFSQLPRNLADTVRLYNRVWTGTGLPLKPTFLATQVYALID